MKKMRKINKEELLRATEFVLVNGAKLAGTILGAALMAAVSDNSNKVTHTSKRRYDGWNWYNEPNYSDAIDAVMNASMFGSDKTKLCDIIRKDESSVYYKSVISIVNSNMFSSDKYNAIKKIS